MKAVVRSGLATFFVAAAAFGLGRFDNANATPDELFDRYFSNVLDGRPCFAKTYEDTHLAAHPTQRVRSIEIELAKSNSDNKPNSADRFELGFALMPKAKPEWYGQTASCKTNDNGFDCFLEGDGGLMHLTPLPNGGLRLETGDTGIAIEGRTDVVELSGKSGDDRVFDLGPARDECDAATEFFESGTGE